jgi:hypothetical protein
MTLPPRVQVIHASDAPQHVAELKAILMRMKSENRISDLIVQDITLQSFTSPSPNENTGGIIILLTHRVESAREEIEGSFMNLRLDMQKLKLIEIIVDNVPYNNHFISFPQDLKPIRSRDDMNLVWQGIEQDLQVIFPVATIPQVEPPRPVQRARYLKLIGLAVLTAVLGTFIIYVVAPELPDNTVFLCMAFAFLLPILIFLIEKKNIEAVPGAINWKRLLMKTCVALVFFFVAFFGYAIVLLIMGYEPRLLPFWLGMVTILLFLFYKARTASVMMTRSGDRR